jgi:hypothetical protein
LSVQLPRGCRHAAAWAFSEKQHAPSPSRLDRNDQHAIWTHLWIDDETGFLSEWLVGPSPVLLDRRSFSEALPVQLLLIVAKPKGAAKKIELHLQALTFFATHRNFCVVNADRATPAMLVGCADREWSAKDLAALVTTVRAEGAA